MSDRAGPLLPAAPETARSRRADRPGRGSRAPAGRRGRAAGQHATRPPVATVEFLRGWAAQARRGGTARPAGDRRSGRRWTRWPRCWGWPTPSGDLLLLAGLPEEHEGLAGTFRSLHPLGEPRPTVGLAALLLAETGVDRAEAAPPARRGTGGPVRRAAGQRDGRAVRAVADPGRSAVGGAARRRRRAARTAPGSTSDRPLPDSTAGWPTTSSRRAGRVVRDRVPATVVITAGRRAWSRPAGAPPCSVRVGAPAVRRPRRSPATRAGDAPQALVHAAARDAVPVLVLAAEPPAGGGEIRPGARPR